MAKISIDGILRLEWEDDVVTIPTNTYFKNGGLSFVIEVPKLFVNRVLYLFSEKGEVMFEALVGANNPSLIYAEAVIGGQNNKAMLIQDQAGSHFTMYIGEDELDPLSYIKKFLVNVD